MNHAAKIKAQDISHEARLPRTRDPGDHGEPLQGNSDINAFEVVEVRPVDLEPVGGQLSQGF